MPRNYTRKTTWGQTPLAEMENSQKKFPIDHHTERDVRVGYTKIEEISETSNESCVSTQGLHPSSVAFVDRLCHGHTVQSALTSRKELLRIDGWVTADKEVQGHTMEWESKKKKNAGIWMVRELDRSGAAGLLVSSPQPQADENKP
ncbi:unnamed protein product [Pleuronectes platessa]|uniref:Uncharacterized protein n=1 Tax=Pleuronectes platessa TaxID=8262 RepID=A0A9N7VE20_PLEPL|nr:unnamed protein product [Pleuronectes platessa]